MARMQPRCTIQVTCSGMPLHGTNIILCPGQHKLLSWMLSHCTTKRNPEPVQYGVQKCSYCQHRWWIHTLVILRSLFYIFNLHSSPKRKEMAGGFIRPHNEELRNLQAAPNVVMVIISRRMRWPRPVARMGRWQMCTTFWLQNLKRWDHL
jgi:hypothetical protein